MGRNLRLLLLSTIFHLKLLSTPSSSTLVLGLICTFLAGCAYKISMLESPPAVEMPARWSLGGKAGNQEWPDNDWWKRFGSSELTELVDEGQNK